MTVFDFDNTIYDGESCFDIFFFYLRKYPRMIIKAVPKFLEGYFRYKRGKISEDTVIDEYGYLLVEYCMKLDHIEDDVVEFWDKYQKKIKPFYAGIQSDEDIIISASPEIMLSEICKRLGIKHYIGSDFDIHTGEVTRVCFRSRKIKAFHEVCGDDARIDTFYTDSMNDKPLMDLSDTVYLVKGEKLTKIKENNQWLIDVSEGA